MNAVTPGPPKPLTADERLHRVMTVCCHFLRNLAFYRAGWRYDTQFQNRVPRTDDHFWANANTNSLDVGVLEWCKLFGESERKGKHRWNRVVSDQQFLRKLLHRLKMTEDEFNAYITKMREYRDWFIAHLDDERIMYPPRMTIGRKSAAFLYDHLRQVEDKNNVLHDFPQSAQSFYSFWFGQGRQTYRKHGQSPR